MNTKNKPDQIAAYYHFCLTQGVGRISEVSLSKIFDNNGADLRKPNKAPTLFAVYQSVAHEIISFYYKVGMFFCPNQAISDYVEGYEDFVMIDVMDFMNPKPTTDNNERYACNVPALFALVVVGIQEGVIIPVLNGIESAKNYEDHERTVATLENTEIVPNPLRNEYMENHIRREMDKKGMPAEKYWYSNIAKLEFYIEIEVAFKDKKTGKTAARIQRVNNEGIPLEHLLYLLAFGKYPFISTPPVDIGAIQEQFVVPFAVKMVKTIFEKRQPELPCPSKPIWEAYVGESRRRHARDEDHDNEDVPRSSVLSRAEVNAVMKQLKNYEYDDDDNKDEIAAMSDILQKKIVQTQDQLVRLIYLQQGLSSSSEENPRMYADQDDYKLARISSTNEFKEMLIQEMPHWNKAKGNEKKNNRYPPQLQAISNKSMLLIRQLVQWFTKKISEDENCNRAEQGPETMPSHFLLQSCMNYKKNNLNDLREEINSLEFLDDEDLTFDDTYLFRSIQVLPESRTDGSGVARSPNADSASGDSRPRLSAAAEQGVKRLRKAIRSNDTKKTPNSASKAKTKGSSAAGRKPSKTDNTTNAKMDEPVPRKQRKSAPTSNGKITLLTFMY